jgi:hypothetical protein
MLLPNMDALQLRVFSEFIITYLCFHHFGGKFNSTFFIKLVHHFNHPLGHPLQPHLLGHPLQPLLHILLDNVLGHVS